MYEEIINVKHLNAVSGAFMSLPARSYSISEIAGAFRVSVSNASHILNRLSFFGILRSFSKQGKKFYIYRPSSSLPAWVKSRVLKNKKKQEDKLYEDLKKLNYKAVFLSGLFSGYANLPVDLLLVGKTDLKKLDKFLHKWKKVMGVEINYSLMTEYEFLERKDTFDKFIKDIFDHRYLTVVDKLKKTL